MRKPPQGELWIHVERLDRLDGKVWAVQYWSPKGLPQYAVVHAVVLRRECYTQFFGAKAKQPKAVIVVKGGTVVIRESVAYVN